MRQGEPFSEGAIVLASEEDGTATCVGYVPRRKAASRPVMRTLPLAIRVSRGRIIVMAFLRHAYKRHSRREAALKSLGDF